MEIFGSACIKCDRLERNVRDSLKETGLEADVVKVTDPEEMVARGVMAIPTLIIDGEVKVSGRMATIKELNNILLGE